MRDREAVNRFCAFALIGWRNYSAGDMDGFLADALRKMNRMLAVELEALRRSFDRSMILNSALFGHHAFRKSLSGPMEGNRSILNIALFDVCSVLFATLDEVRIQRRESQVRQAVRELMLDPSFEDAITHSTNSRKQVSNRFDRMENALCREMK